MYDLLVKLMLVAALAQFGLSLTGLKTCHSRKCVQQLERRSRDILNVDWNPIVAFPKEAKRFQ